MKNAKHTGRWIMQLAITSTLWSAVMPLANADTNANSTPVNATSATVSPWEKCKQQNPQADREVIGKCMHDARKAAFQTCKTGVSPAMVKGTRPSFAQRQQLATCMVNQGFLGKGHHRHHQG
jgi:hypothetical protein